MEFRSAFPLGSLKIILSYTLLFMLTTSLGAQSPWGRGGDDRGRDDRGRDDRGRGGGRDDWMNRVDPSEMLRRADKNGDGKVEPSEIDERFRGFTNRLIERYGMDPKKTVVLDTIKKKFEKMRDGGAPKKEEDISVTFGIPSFDEFADEEPAMVPDFYLSEESVVLQSGSLESRYEKSILTQVDRALQVNDKNRDGVIDSDEIRRGQWQRPASDSDLNKDGKLTKVELAERYVKNSGGRGRIEKGKTSSRSARSSSSGARSSTKKPASSGRSSFSRSSSERSSSSRKSSSSSKDDKITSYAKRMIEKYDKNKNGKLDGAEVSGVRSLPRNADKDGDKVISLDEMIVAYGGKSRGASSSSSSPAKNIANNPYLIPKGSELSQGADSDFQKLDRNLDGLVQMHEFAKSWTDELASSFGKLDANNDGHVSVEEWKKGGGSRSTKSSSRYSRSRGR
ncbi:hypothetical protein N8639_01915 [bacterium]|nr:hypothetical protein [bacterium]